MRCRTLWIVAGALGLASPAWAESAQRAFAIPIGRTPIELGAGFDSELDLPRGDGGTCVEGDSTQRSDATGAAYSLLVLSRAGGRLVLGIHVAAPVFVETQANPRVTDAARRLERANRTDFRALCGDGYVAAVTSGGQFIAELEVDRKDVSRALARLTVGTWSDPEAFREALEAIVKPFVTTARELPGGSRAAARPMTAPQLVERALAFPSTVTAETAKPYLATFEPYISSAFAGTELPEPETLDASTIAIQVFREGRGRQPTAASRAADLRAVQVQRYEPETPAAEESASSPEPSAQAAAGGREAGAAPTAPEEAPQPAAPAAPAPAAAEPSPSAPFPARAIESPPVVSQRRSQAALVFAEAGEVPVFATTTAPAGVYAERVRERSYWVPGAAEATPEVTRAIEKAKADAPARGTTVAVVDVGATTVVMTDAPPLAGIHSVPAGERHAWIAGVASPNPSQRAALAAAVEAEAHAP